VKTEIELEFDKIITSNVDIKYWLIIPSIGSPIMISQHADIEFVKELAIDELKHCYNDKMSIRIVRHEGTLYKYKKTEVPNDIPKEKLLFSLLPGDKVKTLKRLYEDGTIRSAQVEYMVVKPYWIKMNEKTGHLELENTIGTQSKIVKRLSPDGRDDSGVLSVIF